MERINLADAKARLSEIVDRVEAGESNRDRPPGKPAASSFRPRGKGSGSQSIPICSARSTRRCRCKPKPPAISFAACVTTPAIELLSRHLRVGGDDDAGGGV